MLKKQTVWLLTMLSLVVVLSVYYVTSPEGGTSDMVMTEEDQKSSETTVDENLKSEDELATEEQPAQETPAKESTEGTATEEDENGSETEDKGAVEGETGAKENETGAKKSEVQTEELEDGTVISSISSDELFTELRLQVDDQRNEVKEQLQSIVASNEATVNEKSDAYDEMDALNDAAHKEAILETLIKSQGYDDALVRADGTNVKITVKAKDHDKSSANKIMALVRDEMENMEDVIVTFQQ
jgi:stage III sporulation protein AH